MTQYNLSISIVIYKNRFDEIDNIIKLINESKHKILLVIIDNSPNHTNYFKSYKNIKYIFNDKNIGYGSAQNIALRYVNEKSKYHILLNPDVKLEKTFFNESIMFFEKYKKIDVFVPKILNFDGALQYSLKFLPSPIDLVLRLLPKKIYLSLVNILKYEIQRRHSRNLFMCVPYVSGSVVLFRNDKTTLKYLFDERFFLYMEDVEWSRSVSLFKKIIYNPFIVVKHKHNAGSKRKISLFIYHVFSAIKYFSKNGWIYDRDRSKLNNNFEIFNEGIDHFK